MIFAELVISLAWVMVPEGQLIERQLTASRAVPSAWVEPVVEQASIVFHGREDWAMAFFVAAPWGGSGPAPVDAGRPAGQASWVDQQRSPRIYLFAPYYLATDGLVDLASMPVDVAEYYFYTLIEAWLALEQGGTDTAWQQWLTERADLLMADVPNSKRQAAYRAAITDFGAHILSILNEVERHQRRGRVRGRDVCRLIGHPASLFGLWERSFDSGAFSGHYPTPQNSPESGWSGLLERRDKTVFARQVLGVEWSGDVAVDFAGFCARSLTED